MHSFQALVLGVLIVLSHSTSIRAEESEFPDGPPPQTEEEAIPRGLSLPEKSLKDAPKPEAAQAPPQELGTRLRAPWLIAPGEQRELIIKGLKRYSLAGTAVRALPLSKALLKELGPDSKNRLLIKAVQPGTSEIWVWKSDGQAERQTIRVEKPTASVLTPALERALSNLEEVEIFYSGEGVALRGEIHSSRESGRIAALISAFPKEIRDETSPGAELLNRQETEVRAWLQSTSLGSKIHLERRGPVLRAWGSLTHPKERDLAERRIHALCPFAMIDLDSLPDESPVIHFQVYLLELKRTRMGSFGLSWPGSQGTAFRVSSWGISQNLDVQVALQAMEADGTAKILSNPELAVRAPGEAELFAGGELPIKTATHYSSQVTWKNFGLLLKLKVAQATAEKARLEIQTEVSHLDPTLDRDSLPGIQANRIKTQVDAEFGQPLFLSGMLQQDLRKQARGLPLLREIPVLGALFGSEDYLNERSELVAVLVPRTKPPRAPMEKFGKFTRVSAHFSTYPWGALE